ncbi:hypothetical protein CLOP_g13187, partial [Closterium sp. NIES-67]
LRPTKRNGKVVGDKGASGSLVLKLVRYSSTSFAEVSRFRILNVKSGSEPLIGTARTCLTATPAAFTSPFVNATSDKGARRKRYSFFYDSSAGGMPSEANGRTDIEHFLGLDAGDRYVVVGHPDNMLALCGKSVRKVNVKS